MDIATVFVASGTTDGQFQIEASGPADETGENDADIGMFGGSEPYVLSGIPPIPTITEVIVPAFGSITGGLDIEVKGQANQ